MFSVTSVVGAKEMDNSAESSLLYAARNGDIDTVKTLVTAHKENGLLVDLNCTGMDRYIVSLLVLLWIPNPQPNPRIFQSPSESESADVLRP